MNRPSRLSRLIPTSTVGALVLGLALVAPSTSSAATPDNTVVSGTHQTEVQTTRLQMTRSQQAAFDRQLATTSGRTAVFRGLTKAFSSGTGVADDIRSGATRPALSFGWDRDHAWIIASYSDIIRGVISAGVVACKRYLPALPFLCDHVGRLLKNLARGYAPITNHGVWAELYINGRVRSGRY